MKGKNWNWTARAILWLAPLVLAAGCGDVDCDDEKAQADTYPEVFLQKDWPASKSIAARTHRRPYQIREGDKLEIIYFVKPERDPEAYKLNIRDKIGVRFPFNKDLDVKEAEIQSDGMVQLPLVNAVDVWDKSIVDVQQDLTRRYAQYLKSPVLTVSLEESKREIEDLREAITTSPRGQSRLVPVTPGGQVALPLIGSVRVGDLTVDQVQKSIQAEYKNIGVTELQVTVNLEFIAPLRVFVMGEVAKPGLVFNTLGGTRHVTEMSLMQAIAQAGSYIPARAEMSKVLLIRNHGLSSPQIAVVNMRELLQNKGWDLNGQKVFLPDSAKYRHDIWLEDGDIIYVPTKELAERADYIEYVWTRGFYAVVPLNYNLQASYTAVDAVNWIGPR